MLTSHKFNLVPSTYVMEVFDFQDGDPTYQNTRPDGTVMPMGLSLAHLKQRFGGDEGDFMGPSGKTYHISLAPWQGKDHEKTFLRMTFHITPLLLAYIAPELQPSPLSPPSTLPPQATSSPSTLPPQAMSSPSTFPAGSAASSTSSTLRARPSSTSFPLNFISCSDVRREHRIKIQQNPETGVTAEELLRLPEATMTEIHCPVCDAPIRFSETFAKRLQQAIDRWGNEAKVQLIFDHPADIEETRIASEDGPFVVHRYWRYTPISIPVQPKDPDVELSIVQKIHNHFVVVTAGAGETTAQTLLALPEAKQTELSCPLCDEKLPVGEPFEKYIRILADDAGDDTIHIQWSIAHPSDSAETKVPSKEDAIRATRYTSDDEFIPNRYKDEEYINFVVRKKK